MKNFEWEAICRLPLARAVISLFDYIAEPGFLADVFEKHRGRSYEKQLQFATFLFIISDALLQHQGSGHQAIKHFEQTGDLNVSMEAVYAKLRRAPISLSCGLLAECTQRLEELVPLSTTELPQSIKKMQVIVIDGKKIKNVAKRLVPLRKMTGSLLGGKVVAALSLNSGMVIHISADPDGEVNDNPLLPGLLNSIHESISERILFILDAQFCDLTQPPLLSADGNYYLIRHHPKVSFHRDKTVNIRRGKNNQDLRYTEEWGYLGSAKGKKEQIYVRKITLKRPGKEGIVFITNLLDADVYPASDLLDAYLMRWSIEMVFQKITEVFHLNNLIASTPEGTIFQCAFCMLLYNMLELIRNCIASEQQRNLNEISMANFCYDAHRELVAWDKIVGPTLTVSYFKTSRSSLEMRELLSEILCDVWSDLWIKSVRQKRCPSDNPATRKTIKGGHTSVARILKQHKTKPK